MKVRNVHERILAAPLPTVARLLDSLASEDDLLWPRDSWPPMRFDCGLCVGAAGGHGPVRYVVDSYEPGQSVRFRFTKPRGFDGYHAYEIEEAGPGTTRLRHVLDMRASGGALLTWPLIYRPLHDALIEDSLDRAQSHCGAQTRTSNWSGWVRALRWILRRRRSKKPARSAV